jgi:uncharacterized phage-associated protein
MLTCFDVAEYFLSLADEDAGDLISNLKLQKLVYYAQGFHLAFYGKSLFNSDIEAWDHGPVVPELYHKYKQHGSGGIPLPTNVDFAKYDEDTRALLDEIHEVFGQYSAWKLRNMTHNEPPWKNTKYGVISQKVMKEYFETLIEDE